MKKILSVTLLATAAISLTACNGEPQMASSSPENFKKLVRVAECSGVIRASGNIANTQQMNENAATFLAIADMKAAGQVPAGYFQKIANATYSKYAAQGITAMNLAQHKDFTDDLSRCAKVDTRPETLAF